MHSLRKIAVLALGLAASLPAWAQSSSGYYVGLGMNSTRFNVNDANVSSGFALSPAATIDADSFNFALVGGYRFDDFLALQTDFLSGGSVRATDTGLTTKLFDVSMLTISAAMTLVKSERVTLYAKLGGSFWQFTQGSASTLVTLNDGFGPSFGAGLDINIYGGGDRRLRLEWTHHIFDKVLVKNGNSLVFGGVFFF